MTNNVGPPQIPKVQSGVLRPPTISVRFGAVLGSLLLAAAAWIEIASKQTDMAAALGFVGGIFAVASVPQVLWNHEVRWNEKGIEGPAKMFGLTLGPTRTEIAWSDIVQTGRSMTGYWYVESSDGRRVYWSYLCSGYDALTQALRFRCPMLPHDFHLPT